MEITLADQYYLKAIDYYPYNMEDAIENLNYALSYDPEHTHANCLMGRVQAYQFKNHEEARYYFEQTLIANPRHLDTHRYYSGMLMELREYDHARKLIEHAFTIKGCDLGIMRGCMGLLAEYEGKYEEAIHYYTWAKEHAYNQDLMNELDEDISRARQKMSLKNPFVYNG